MQQPSDDVPGWAADIPANIGTPTMRKPDKCNACVVPIWRWNGAEWVCYNCLLHQVKYENGDGDMTSLKDCKASGVYREDDPWG